MSDLRIDPEVILESLEFLLDPGQIVELRVLNATTGTRGFTENRAGYYDREHLPDLARHIADVQGATGFYFTLNPVAPELHARAFNRLKKAEKDGSTKDKDIAHRRLLLVDIDADRPSGISATEDEKSAAETLALQIKDWLTAQGWPEPVQIDSGNGAHLLYRVDLPAEDGGLVRRCLEALGQRFDSANVHVDTSVANAARITKLPGTPVRKGDSTPTRPHRMARLVSQPQEFQTVATAQLEALAVLVAPPQTSTKATPDRKPKATGPVFDLAGFVTQHLPEATGPNTAGFYEFTCPWRPEDGRTGFVGQLESGALSAGCNHATCPGSNSTGNHWLDLKLMFIPEIPEAISDAVHRLAKLPTIEYEVIRKAEADRLGIRVAVLDDAVVATRGDRTDDGMFPTVDPWPKPVDAAGLLDEIHETIKRHIVCDPAASVAATLWIAFTWFIDHVQVAPIAIITAPEKRCGKSQLLDLMGRMSRRPLSASNVSPAATFRVIESQCPTLLIDEVDSFMRDNEEMRGIINSGHTRQSAFVLRTVGDDHEPKCFSTWAAKVLCGIGRLPPTIEDRSIILALRRKTKAENVQRIRHADPRHFEILAKKLARLAEDHGEAIGAARPSLPESLNDRAQDNWEPLLAIADLAGGSWPQRARNIAVGTACDEDEGEISTMLLSDIQATFANLGGVERISTCDLITHLCADDTRPWATYARNGVNKISPRQLSGMLKPFGIGPDNIKFPGNVTIKGYRLNQFGDAFSRYLAPQPSSAIRYPATVEEWRGSMGSELVAVADVLPLPSDDEAVAVADDLSVHCNSATPEPASIFAVALVADVEVAGGEGSDAGPGRSENFLSLDYLIS